MSVGTWPLVAIIVLTTIIAVVAVAAAKESKDLDLDTIGQTPKQPAARRVSQGAAWRHVGPPSGHGSLCVTDFVGSPS